MADSFVNVMKYFLTPGSAFFLLIVVTVGLALLSLRRTRRVGTWWLIVFVLGYWLLSLPVMCDWLGGTLPRWLSPTGGSPAAPQAIVVLSAGVSRVGDSSITEATMIPDDQTALNAIAGARLYKRTGSMPIIASGGCFDCTIERPESEAVRQILIAHGVPADRIIEESRSNTTHEQAQFVSAILQAHGWNCVFLVTSPVHLLRARASFTALGINAMAAPAAFHTGLTEFSYRWRPTPDALTSSEESMYDYLGYFYYWARGWLRAPSQSTTR